MNKIIKQIGNEIIKMGKQNNKFVVNPTQMSKYNYAKGFFCKYLRENKGNLITDINPNNLNAGLTATTTIMDIIKVDLRRFTNILKFSSAVTLDTTKDGKVCISLTIPNVYTKEIK